MHFESRLCNEDNGHGEINCLMQQISDLAKSVCGCQPWYAFEVGGQHKYEMPSLGKKICIYMQPSRKLSKLYLNLGQKAFINQTLRRLDAKLY